MSRNSSSNTTASDYSSVDDTSSLITWTGPWTSYRGDQTLLNSTIWKNASLTTCGGEGTKKSAGPCYARIPFNGTYGALYGDAGAGLGTYHCSLERTNSSGILEPETTWNWYFGQEVAKDHQINTLLCAVKDIPAGEHQFVIGIEADQVDKGVSVDYLSTSSSLPAGLAYSWQSFYGDAVPPQNWRNTTEIPRLPSETSTNIPSIAATLPSHHVPHGSNKLAVGLGVGLGVGLALLAALAGWFFYRRRAKRRAAGAEQLSDEGSNWYPEPGEAVRLTDSAGGGDAHEGGSEEEKEAAALHGRPMSGEGLTLPPSTVVPFALFSSSPTSPHPPPSFPSTPPPPQPVFASSPYLDPPADSSTFATSGSTTAEGATLPPASAGGLGAGTARREPQRRETVVTLADPAEFAER
ncbi:hypothetical protein JCM8097_009415 [Rhodosporidiobolus ruineniae]